MAYKIGFTAEYPEPVATGTETITAGSSAAPKCSVAEVFFPERGRSYSYYNDRFDLHRGDMVYVEGKLEGVRGRVLSVNYNFKIKLSEYKRVIGIVDTDISGKFFIAGSHIVSFERTALPRSKVASWYMAPSEEEDFVTGRDDTEICLENMHGLDVSEAVYNRGNMYYVQNCVRYLCVDGTRGYAIVEGTKPYELDFEYRDGKVFGLTCSCFCGGTCKHEVAVLFQLRETLERIAKQYAEEFERTGYFAAVEKGELYSLVLEEKTEGSFII